MRKLARPLIAMSILLPLAALLGCGSDNLGTDVDNLATSVAVMDLDGNGRMDVVTAFDRSYSSGAPDDGFVSTRLGQGTSGLSFGAPIRSYGGHNPGPMAAVDLDNDGHADLVLCNASSSTLTLLYGTATAGAFSAPVTLQLNGRYAYAVAVADFNGDGKPDIAVAASGGSSVLLFLQNAGGGFSGVTPSSITVNGTPYSIATAVLESGGHQDLAVGLGTGQLAILKGNGDGTFQTETDYACGTTPAAIKIADLDGANGPDIAVADYTASSSVIVFLNNGSGVFAAGVAYATGDSYAADLAIGDLNNDGIPDIAVANSGAAGDPGSLAVMINNGSGAFGGATLYHGLQGPLSVAIADIDGDGLNDLVSADGTGVVHLQDPSNIGYFMAPVQLYY